MGHSWLPFVLVSQIHNLLEKFKSNQMTNEIPSYFKSNNLAVEDWVDKPGRFQFT